MHPGMMRPGAHPDMQQSGFPLSDKLKTLYRPDQGQIMQPSGPSIYPDVPETRQDWYAANGQMMRMGQRGAPAGQPQTMQPDMGRMGPQQRMMSSAGPAAMQKMNQQPAMAGFDPLAPMQPDMNVAGSMPDPSVQNPGGVPKSPFMGRQSNGIAQNGQAPMMGDPLNSQAPMQVQRSPLVVKSPAMNAKMTAQQSSAQFAANQQVNMVDTSVSMMQPTSSTSQADLFGSNGPLDMPPMSNQAPVAQNDANFGGQPGGNQVPDPLGMGQMMGGQQQQMSQQQRQQQMAMERKQMEAQRQQKLMSMQASQQMAARSTPMRVNASPSMQQASGGNSNGGMMMSQQNIPASNMAGQQNQIGMTFNLDGMLPADKPSQTLSYFPSNNNGPQPGPQQDRMMGRNQANPQSSARFQQRHAQMQQQRGAMMTAPQQQPQQQQPGFGTFNGGQQPQQQMNGQGGFDPFSMSNQQQQQQAWEAQMRAPQQGQRQGPGQAGFPANGRM